MTKPGKTVLDFTNVKEAGAFSPKHMPSGEYLAEITDVTEETSKKQNKMWVFKVVLKKDRTATYAHHCTLTEESLWKVRNLLVAAGKVVPKKKVGVDPTKLIGKEIGIILDDDEYEGKIKSAITGVFPAADMPADETKTAKKKATKKKVEEDDVEDEDDDVTEEDEEVMDVDDL